MLLFAGLLFNALSHSALLVLLGPFIKTLLSQEREKLILGSTLFPQISILHSLSFYPKDLALWIPLGLFGAASLRALAIFLYERNGAIIALSVATDYRNLFFRQLIQKPYLFVASKSPAQWMSHMVSDVLYLQTRFSDIFKSLIYDLIMMISALLSLIWIHPKTGLLLLFGAPLVGMFSGRIGKKIGTYAQTYQENMALLSRHILDIRKRFLFIQAQKGQDREAQSFDQIHRTYSQTIKNAAWLKASFAPGMEFLGFATFAFLLLHLEAIQDINILVFFGALGLLFKPMKNIGEQLSRFHETFGALQGGEFAFCFDDPTPPLPTQAPSESFPGLTLEQLSFQHPKGLFPLSLPSVVIPKGKRIAVLGPSGSGKSTFLKILAGLIPPDEWKANLGWSQVAALSNYVGQSPFLFQGTLLENLTYGQKEKSPKLGGILSRFFSPEEDIHPNQTFDPLQATFSGGQIQRLALARAFLRQDKPLWLFDEASSGLSVEGERQLLEEIKKENKTVLFVTHRKEHLDDFDEIWFLKEGALVAKGPHGRLLGTEPEYRKHLAFPSQSNLGSG